MKRFLIEPSFEAWRRLAREHLLAGYLPEQLDLQDAAAPAVLDLALEPDEPPVGQAIPHPHVPRPFLEAARLAAVHRDPQRWNLLYRILFRLQADRNLLHRSDDDDVLQITRLEAQVRRDLHAMQAFVRFRKVLDPSDPSERPVVLDQPIPISLDGDPHAHHLVLETPTPFGPLKTELESCPPEELTPDADCEHFIAWYQPEHRILPLAAPFFAERYAIMHWTLLTPDASAVWDPISQRLTFAPGVARQPSRHDPPEQEELEDLWRTYYASIFNPSRPSFPTEPSTAPTLPSTSLLPASKSQVHPSPTRHPASPPPTRSKSSTQPSTHFAEDCDATASSAQPFLPAEHSLRAIAAALPSCRGCNLFCHATQAVGGRGPQTAALMLVGEQPGDQEDRQGAPFVGPAGAVLDRILDELRIPRSALYVTNAVKHFKFIQRGKLRLHQNPRLSEIAACRPWLLAEIDAVKPRVVLCLGASASKSLLGASFALMKDHGKLNATPFAERVFATVHPSAVLRARDDQNRRQLHQFLTEDLAKAWQAAQPEG